MEIKTVGDYLYKSDGEFSILYDSIKKVNEDFSRLILIKEVSSKQKVKDAMIDVIRKVNHKITDQEIKGVEQLTDSLVNIIFKDIKECHKTIYG